MNTTTLSTDIFKTALGWIAIQTSDHGVVRTTLPEPRYEDARDAVPPRWNPSVSPLEKGREGDASPLAHKGELPPTSPISTREEFLARPSPFSTHEESLTRPSPFSHREEGELKGVQSGDAMNPLRLATLDASPFCCAKGGGAAADSEAILDAVKDRLIRYCDGEDVGFDDIPIHFDGWTAHTERARAACRTIPRGETRSYAWLAEQASGSRKTARAAARAMSTNPLPIIIPCHRVIGSDGKLHGFGGTIGIPLKAKLLEMERN